MAINLDSANFETEVLNETSLPVLVDFWAPWCGPCRSIAPILEQFAEKHKGRVKVCKLNTDENQDLSALYSVMSIPTLLVFKNGKVINKAVGLQGLSALENLVF